MNLFEIVFNEFSSLFVFPYLARQLVKDVHFLGEEENFTKIQPKPLHVELFLRFACLLHNVSKS